MLSPRILLTLSATSLVLGSLGYAAITQAASPTPEPSQIAQTPQSSPGQQQGPAGAQGAPRPRGPRHDFAAAAQRLGVTEQALRSALGVPDQPPRDGSRPPRPDFAAAAQRLGVTEAALKEALGVPAQGPRGGRPDFAAVAQELGVTEQALRNALGVPDQPPRDGSRPNRPDLSAAAQQLGVTEAQLQEALRTHRSGDRGPRPMMTE